MESLRAFVEILERKADDRISAEWQAPRYTSHCAAHIADHIYASPHVADIGPSDYAPSKN